MKKASTGAVVSPKTEQWYPIHVSEGTARPAALAPTGAMLGGRWKLASQPPAVIDAARKPGNVIYVAPGTSVSFTVRPILAQDRKGVAFVTNWWNMKLLLRLADPVENPMTPYW